ncbi:MAG: metallophosphoesterase [Planctomycetes bacterium]|nr:metallophosphoesterase [Planctomycetota bacterium]
MTVEVPSWVRTSMWVLVCSGSLLAVLCWYFALGSWRSVAPQTALFLLFVAGALSGLRVASVPRAVPAPQPAQPLEGSLSPEAAPGAKATWNIGPLNAALRDPWKLPELATPDLPGSAGCLYKLLLVYLVLAPFLAVLYAHLFESAESDLRQHPWAMAVFCAVGAPLLFWAVAEMFPLVFLRRSRVGSLPPKLPWWGQFACTIVVLTMSALLSAMTLDLLLEPRSADLVLWFFLLSFFGQSIFTGLWSAAATARALAANYTLRPLRAGIRGILGIGVLLAYAVSLTLLAREAVMEYRLLGSNGMQVSPTLGLFGTYVAGASLVVTWICQSVRDLWTRTRPRGKSLGRETRRGPADGNFPHQTKVGLAHWSDLHLTVSDSSSRLEGRQSGNPALRELIKVHGGALKDAEGLVVTGDITDTGSKEEWLVFLDLWSKFPGSLKERTVIVPGNHDVNITDADRGLWESQGGEWRRLRLVMCIAILDTIQGDRAKILDGANKLVFLHDYLKSFSGPLCALLRSGNQFRRLECAGEVFGQSWLRLVLNSYSLVRTGDLTIIDEVWERIFPMIVRLKCGITVVGLNSAAPSYNILTNAVGEISTGALERLRKLRSHPELKGEPLVYAMHHHLLAPSEAMDPKLAATTAGMMLANPHALLAALPEERETVVLHGHRHFSLPWPRADDHPAVISAPSTTLGDENRAAAEKGPGFNLIPLEWDSAGNVVVTRQPDRCALPPRT